MLIIIRGFMEVHNFIILFVTGFSYFWHIEIRDVSSVGSERMLHTHEVGGSNPPRPTSFDFSRSNQLFPIIIESFEILFLLFIPVVIELSYLSIFVIGYGNSH